jgi:hypothetical protein
LNHILFALNINRQPIADVSHPAIYGEETSGINHVTFVPRVSFLLSKNFLERLVRSYVIRRFHPLVICYVLGVVTMLIGAAGVPYALFSPTIDTFLGGMASVAVGTLGGLLLVLGLWFDIADNEGLVHKVNHTNHHRTQRRVDDRSDTGSGFEVYQDGGTAETSRKGGLE